MGAAGTPNPREGGLLMSENELANLKAEIAGLKSSIDRLYGRADAAYGEALACRKVLTQILRSIGERDPALLAACIDVPIPSINDSGLSPVDRASIQPLCEILRPFQREGS